MSARVTVIGGGYGGIAVAKALDDIADVVLVEPREVFTHNVAALRGLVDPAWTERLFLPYGRLLARGRVLPDRAVSADSSGVTLGSGQRLSAEFLVLATGSDYPFPAKIDAPRRADAIAALRDTRRALAGADRVLLLGAGPVGLELAGEINAVWPEKTITILDPADDIVATGGYPAEFRAELRGQLDALGVTLLLGTTLREPPPTEPGEAKTFTATTRAGQEIGVDIWFRCFGVRPASDYLVGDLAPARRADGHVEVTTQLRLPDQERVFALGDLTAIPEAKMAKAAGDHAAVIAANIRALIAGDGELTDYRAAAPGISLPLGPRGGASYAEGIGVLGAAATAKLKGADLRIGPYLELFGLA